jgi:DNA-binding transcriptional LysR family regulator
VDDNLTLLGATQMGMGIAVLPTYVARDALATGALQCLLHAYPLQENWFRAFVPKRRYRLARIEALVKWLAADMSQFAVHPGAGR